MYVASASYLAVVAALFLLGDRDPAVASLFAAPIAVFTCAVGIGAGLASALLAALALVTHWDVADLDFDAGVFFTRALAFTALPPLIAWARYRRPAHDASEPPPAAAADRSDHGLTKRENEVLQLLARGYTNPQIADQLYISVRTVEGHRARLQRKLGRSGRAELVSFALEHDLISRN